MNPKRTILVVLFAVAAGSAFVAAQSTPACPAVIASLLPKSGSIRGGSYNNAGTMGMGSGAAGLAFDHPCTKSEKFPARISVAVTYYGGEMAQMLQMQGPMANEQTLTSAMNELGEGKNQPRREKLGNGEIVYVTYESPCQPETIDTGKNTTYPPTPHVKLKGVALTDNVRLEVDLEGRISWALAKAAVQEVFENLKKADFSKAN